MRPGIIKSSPKCNTMDYPGSKIRQKVNLATLLHKIRLPWHIIHHISYYCGACGGVFGWGTMLQAGKSRVRIPMRWNFFFNLPNPSNRTMVLVSTQPLTNMSTRNLPGGGKVRPVRRAEVYRHLWADCLDVGTSTSHSPMGLHGLLQG
jgi:hypothetical protein